MNGDQISAQCVLQKLRSLSPRDITRDRVLDDLRTCISIRYGIRRSDESSFDRLAIESIRFRDNASAQLSDAALRRRVHQYDCHQTTLLVKMKTLFTMFVERELDITVDDNAVSAAKTLDTYADLVYRALCEGHHA